MATTRRRGHRGTVARFVVGLVALFALMDVTVLVTIAIAPVAAGRRPVVVTSGSMQPGVQAGDVIVARPHRGRLIRTGTLVVFRMPGSLEQVSHRVVGRNGDGTYRTRGDANSQDDSTPLRDADIVATAELIVPFVGRPRLWAAAGQWPYLGAAGLIAAVLTLLSSYALLAEHDPWLTVPRRAPTKPRAAVRLTSTRGRVYRGAVAGVLVIAAVAVATGTAPGRAAFGATTSNAANSLAAASSFATACVSRSPNFVAGFERGPSLANTWGTFDGGAVTGAAISVDSGAGRDSTYALGLAKNAAGAGYIYRLTPTGSATIVTRFALWFDALPTADVASLAAVNPNAGSMLTLRYVAATNQLALAFGTGTPVTSTATVTAGRWYVIDLRVNLGANPRIADWRVDSVAQTSTSSPEATSTGLSWRFGSGTTSDVYSVHYDDFVISTAAADYPFGDGRTRLLLPSGMGTSSGESSFQQDDGAALGPNTHLRLDDIPMNSTTDFVKQVTAGSSSYAEFALGDTTSNCFNGLLAVGTYHSLAGGGANSAKASLFAGTTETVLHSGDFGSSTMSLARVAVTAPAGGWTQAAVNGLVARLGYATDVAPVPAWDAVAVEYDVQV